ncbi:MAG: hypothetical protein HYZ49_08625 [Chloroflexi bacterium]|nr:hypothetical protein [Chloroflexota bacterium]
MKNNRLRNILIVVLVGIVGTCICLVATVATRPKGTSTPQVAQVEQVESAVATQAALTEVAPTDTPPPTNTPRPTDPPTETPIPTNTPEPIVLSGNGDSIVDAVNPFGAAIVHITGNAGAHFFAVKNYNESGDSIDLLVNTTDPYDGVRPLDFRDGQATTRFEVTATGDWTIEILPLASMRVLTAPGVFNGKGDDVILVEGGVPDLAKIKGNAGARYFGVRAWSDSGRDSLVNTTDPYEGTQILPRSDFLILEIQAEGEWSIEVTTK